MEAPTPRYLTLVELAATLLLFLFPSCMLFVKGGMNGILLLMLLLALTCWIARPASLTAIVWKREWTAYVIAMAAMSAAILASQAWHSHFVSRYHDAASRYWLAVPIFLLLYRLRPQIFAALQYGLPLAAIAGYMLASGGERSTVSTLDPIHFGNFELMLGILSLFSLDWLKHDGLALRMLKVAGFAAGMAASFASGSRGGWLALPLFILLFAYSRAGRLSLRWLGISVAGGALAFVLLISSNAHLQIRIAQLNNDLAALKQGQHDTSLGIRLQLYRAAGEIFLEHPVFGVGPDGFAREMTTMQQAGKITPLAAELGRGEVHSDLLAKTVGMGLIGLTALLASYLIPLALFHKAWRSASPVTRRSGMLGIVFVSGVFVFGLTVEFLSLTMAVAFYSFTVAVLLAACYNIHLGDKPACDTSS